jgi:H+/Cl- antiporter ClcA
VTESLLIIPQLLKWAALSVLVGIMAGTASAAFLISLDWATLWRESHTWIIALLPLGGFLAGWVYHQFGRSVERGNDLVIDEIHNPQTTLKLRMTPLVLFGTMVTQFFGGSGGREGAAVQMGASLADQLTGPLKLRAENRRILLMAGMSAGFGSVFGTPLAGMIFGLEVLEIGRLKYDALFPCFIAAVVGNQVTLAWGVHHSSYPSLIVPGITLIGACSAVIAGALFGITGMLFGKSTHALLALLRKKVVYPPLRPLLGGLVVALAVLALGTTRYIGLGIPVIGEAFRGPIPPWDWALKFAFTVVTLGSGFKGGEVTPLFFIGATLGNALGLFMPLPQALLCAMGFVAVFAGAANTPITCTLMAMELFGSDIGVYAALACVTSYLFSGHAGIYHTQKVGRSKHLAMASCDS